MDPWYFPFCGRKRYLMLFLVRVRRLQTVLGLLNLLSEWSAGTSICARIINNTFINVTVQMTWNEFKLMHSHFFLIHSFSQRALRRWIPPFHFAVHFFFFVCSVCEDSSQSGFHECIFIILLVSCARNFFLLLRLSSSVFALFCAFDVFMVPVHFEQVFFPHRLVWSVLLAISRCCSLCNALWHLFLTSMAPFYETQTDCNLSERWMTSWSIDVYGLRVWCRFFARCSFAYVSLPWIK